MGFPGRDGHEVYWTVGWELLIHHNNRKLTLGLRSSQRQVHKEQGREMEGGREAHTTVLPALPTGSSISIWSWAKPVISPPWLQLENSLSTVPASKWRQVYSEFKKKNTKKTERAILICFHVKRGALFIGSRNDIQRDITLHHMANLHSRPKAGFSFIRTALKIRLQKHV